MIVKKTNFPKLVNVAKHNRAEDRGPARKIIETIESSSFDERAFRKDYKWEQDRIRTLFWLPDVLRDPDAIYRNGHAIIQGDEVYVRVYDKMGSKGKLVFVGEEERKTRYVVTSFLTSPQVASDYVRGRPIYTRPQKATAAIAAAASPVSALGPG